MFETVLIANRGEIAVRAIRTLKRLGVTSVAVYSDADRNAQHVRDADIAIAIGGDKPADSYLRIDKILAAAKETGAQAIYPGYGFLSESAEFAEACEAAGIAFVGPTPTQIREFGLKHRARELAGEARVPMAPGTGLLDSLEQALAAAETIGYPVMLKTTAGGGGIGLTRCADAEALASAYDSVKRMGEQFFSDAGVFLERFVYQARHVEVQIFGDGTGRVVALGERDCSLQRRNQKVVEETPAPNLPQATRERLHAAAVQLGESVGYRSAGTVEFIYDAARDDFYFLEVNTRLQVEHPVTEAVSGLDLIECMLRVAAGDELDWAVLRRAPQGAAIEVRLYAEDPLKNFQPSPGVLSEVHFPDDVRVDGWVSTGSEVSAFYDPMIAKLIVHGASRNEAIAKLRRALGETRLHGIASNLDYLRQVVADERFAKGEVWTRLLDDFAFNLQADAAQRGSRPVTLVNGSDDDMLRLGASLERIPGAYKAEVGAWLLKRLQKADKKGEAADTNTLWALARVGARQPFHGSAHEVVDSATVAEWLHVLLALDWKKVEPAAFAATHLARMTGDRSRDIADELRAIILARLKAVGAPSLWQAMVSEVTQLDEANTKRMLGEALPPGLKLIG